MKELRVDRQSIEERDSDLSLSAIVSLNCWLELRIIVLISLCNHQNVFQ